VSEVYKKAHEFFGGILEIVERDIGILTRNGHPDDDGIHKGMLYSLYARRLLLKELLRCETIEDMKSYLKQKENEVRNIRYSNPTSQEFSTVVGDYFLILIWTARRILDSF